VGQILGQLVVDHLGPARVVEAFFNGGESKNAAHFGHEKISLIKGHAVGHGQPVDEGDDAIGGQILILIDYGVYPPVLAGSHVQDTRGTQGHGACTGHLVAVEIDFKAGRQADGLQHHPGFQICLGWNGYAKACQGYDQPES